MNSSYIIESKRVIVNFTDALCKTPEQVLNSPLFMDILNRYLNRLKLKEDKIVKEFINIENFNQLLIDFYLKLFENNKISDILFLNKEVLIEFTEGLYDYWRHLSRYGLINSTNKEIEQGTLIKAQSRFNDLIIAVYRFIVEKLMSTSFNVYRQLPAGINASIEVESFQDTCYLQIPKCAIIKKILIRPPFIANTKTNKRTGFFVFTDHNLLNDVIIDANCWFMLPIWVGKKLAYFYFNIKYIHHAIGLCNLFKVASKDEYLLKDVELYCFFGIDYQNETSITSVYHDLSNNKYLGFINNNDANDYFGYAKKMLLTLHNMKSINEGNLPIHGAMFSITFSNNSTKNIIIIGDSGAGKSETIEAVRGLGNYQINTIYDDMGILSYQNGKVVSSGTEIGAFVRLDDLDSGYAYEEIDRAIFMNPSKLNARIVIPISKYEDIIKSHPIDLVLYANNYEHNQYPLKIIEDYDLCKNIFIEGVRQTKATSSEIGIVKTFFANPFGPMQMKNESNRLITKYFNSFQHEKIKVGQLYTRLGILGYEKSGPNLAAHALLEYLQNISRKEEMKCQK